MALISRILGPIEQGRYSLAIFFANVLFVVFNFGLPSATIYFIGRKGREGTVDAIFNLFLFYIVLGVAGAVIFLSFLGNILFSGLSDVLLFLGVSFFSVKMALAFYQNFFLAEENIRNYNSIMIAQLLLLIFVFALYLISPSAFTVVNLMFGQLLSLLITLYYSLYLSGGVGFMYKKTNFPYRTLFGYGLNSHFNNVVAFLIYRVDLLVINYYLGFEAVGYYAIAILIAENLLILSSSASTALLSRLVNIQGVNIPLVVMTGKFVMYTTLGYCVRFFFKGNFKFFRCN